MLDRRFAIAPMMGLTDRHGRFLLRLLTAKTLLYTDMIPARAFLRRPEKLRASDAPLALQLAGDDPVVLAEAACAAQEDGYCEINLNAGCPSPRAVKGGFGAVWMRSPQHAGHAVAAVKQAGLPVSVKCRLGIDDQNPTALRAFAQACRENGAAALIVHARKAWLKGLSPADNRTRPPLDYESVRALKHDMSDCQMILNGGITSLEQAKSLYESGFDGVMIGRAAFADPIMLARADPLFFAAPAPPTSRDFLIARLADYLARESAPPSLIVRSWMHLFRDCPGARQWRRFLGETLTRAASPAQALRDFAARREDRAAA